MEVPGQILIEVLLKTGEVAAIETVGVTGSFTAIVIVLLVAVPVAHIEEVITTYTLSPFANDELVKVLLNVAAPTGFPFKYHWYVGEPPLVELAVMVTVVPAQILLVEAIIPTEGVTTALTVNPPEAPAPAVASNAGDVDPIAILYPDPVEKFDGMANE